MSCCEYGRFKFGLTQHRPIDQDHKSVLKITNMRYIITFNVLGLDMYSGFFFITKSNLCVYLEIPLPLFTFLISVYLFELYYFIFYLLVLRKNTATTR